MLSIHGATEQAAAEALCDSVEHESPTSYGCWIGLAVSSESWKWTDATETDYGFDGNGNPITGADPWFSSHPDSSNNEECAHLWSWASYWWNDIVCSGKPCYPLCAGDGTGTVLFSRAEEPWTVRKSEILTFIDISDEMHFEMVCVRTVPHKK